MRKFVIAGVLGLAMWLGTSAESHAQIRITNNFGPSYPYYPAAVGGYNYNSYATPYSYGYNNYNYQQTPFGTSVQYQQFNNRAIYTGPAHSVYWDPMSNSYKYGGGLRNGSVQYGYGGFGYIP